MNASGFVLKTQYNTGKLGLGNKINDDDKKIPDISGFVKKNDKKKYVCVLGGKKCSFFGKLGVLCFLETPVLRFALLPFYRQIMGISGACFYFSLCKKENYFKALSY